MQHPNIVAYRESFVDDSGHLCIFMEYCERGHPRKSAVGEQQVDLPGLVNIQKANWKITIYGEFSHEKL